MSPKKKEVLGMSALQGYDRVYKFTKVMKTIIFTRKLTISFDREDWYSLSASVRIFVVSVLGVVGNVLFII